MYIHQQNWQNAMRVAEEYDPSSISENLGIELQYKAALDVDKNVIGEVTTLCFFESSKNDVASFKFNVRGFSTITGLPFLIASDAISKWVLGGVAIIIPSISDERVISCQLSVTS